MYVHVSQSRHQVVVGALNPLTTLWNLDGSSRSDRDDLAVLNNDRLIAQNDLTIHRHDIYVDEGSSRGRLCCSGEIGEHDCKSED